MSKETLDKVYFFNAEPYFSVLKVGGSFYIFFINIFKIPIFVPNLCAVF